MLMLSNPDYAAVMEHKTHYMVSARANEYRTVDGRVLVKEDAKVWLYVQKGHPHWNHTRETATRFDTRDVLANVLSSLKRLPLLCYPRIKEDSMEVVEVNTMTTIVELTQPINSVTPNICGQAYDAT